MSLKNKLAAQAKQTLSVSHKTVAMSNFSELDKITQIIQSDLLEMQDIQEFVIQKRSRYLELRENIVKNLIYVRDNKKILLQGKFEDFLEQKIGITKGYFYEQVQAYEICQIYEKPELFSQVDYKILVMIAREKNKDKQKQLIHNATTLNRKDFKKVSLTDSTQQELKIQVVNKRTLSVEFARELSDLEIEEFMSNIKKYGHKILKK